MLANEDIRRRGRTLLVHVKVPINLIWFVHLGQAVRDSRPIPNQATVLAFESAGQSEVVASAFLFNTLRAIAGLQSLSMTVSPLVGTSDWCTFKLERR